MKNKILYNKNKNSVKTNFIMNAILSLSSVLFPLITFPYISRTLLPEGIGKVSFATSIISYFSLFSQLGIPIYGIRACAIVRDDKEKLSQTVQEIFLINFAASILTYTIFFVTLFSISKLSENRILLIITSLTIAFNLIGMEWLYKALEQYKYITIRSLSFKIIALISVFLLINDKNDYLIYAGISIFSTSASNILNFIHVHHYITLRPIFGYNIKRHFKKIIIFFGMACATTIYLHMDTVMLGFMTTDIDVGYYNVAIKIKVALVNIVTSIGAVLLPRTSYYIEHKKINDFIHISEKAINFVFVFASPLVIFFEIFSSECIFFVFGYKYAEAIIPMRIIMPTVLIIGLSNIMAMQILVPCGKEHIVLCAEIFAGVIDLIVNIILIPKLLSSGAAIGTLLAEVIVCIIVYTSMDSKIKIVFTRIGYIYILTALLTGGILANSIKKFAMGNFLTLMFAALAFFGSYLSVLIFFKEPIAIKIKQEIITKSQIKRQ